VKIRIVFLSKSNRINSNEFGSTSHTNRKNIFTYPLTRLVTFWKSSNKPRNLSKRAYGTTQAPHKLVIIKKKKTRPHWRVSYCIKC